MSATLLNKRMPDTWAAKWIDPELPHDEKQRQPASVLRRRFTVKKLGNAVLYITCHGLYEAVLNDVRVGDFVLAPGTGDYRKRLAVQAYDVSELLREGENVVEHTVPIKLNGGIVFDQNGQTLKCKPVAQGMSVGSTVNWEIAQ